MKHASLFSLRRLTKLFYAMGVMMLVFGMLLSAVSMPVHARGMDPADVYTSVTPEYVPGNPNCPSGYTQEKFERGEYGSTKEPITMSVSTGQNGVEEVTWSSTEGIDIVFVKGANGANKYSYNDAFGDSGLVSPVNASGGPADVSHVTFCYGDETDPDDLSVSWKCGEGKVLWYIDNPNAFDVEITYTISGSEPVTTTAKAGYHNFLQTDLSSGDQVVTISWDGGGDSVTASNTLEECSVTEDPDPLVVGWDCAVEDGFITWTLTNPSGNDTATYSFELSDGATDTGSGSVDGGGTVVLTTSAVSDSDQSMSVSWSIGSYSSSSGDSASVADMAKCDVPDPDPDPLVVNWDCAPEDGFVRWTLENPNSEAASYTYTLTGGASETDSGSVAGGATVTLTTSAVSDAAQEMSVSWSIEDYSSTSTGSASVADMAKCDVPDPDPLVVGWDCAVEDGFITWTLTNPSGNDTATYSYELSGGATDDGSGSVAGGDTVTLTTSAVTDTAQSMSVDWSIGDYDDTSGESASPDDMEACKADLLQPLQVSWDCNEDEETIDWKIYNPNTVPVNFDYELTIGASKKIATEVSADPGQAIFLNKEITTVDQEMVVTWNDGESDQTDNDTATAGQMALCPQGPPPVPGLTLEYVCGYEEEFTSVNYKWRLSNPDEDPVEFTWQVAGEDESGSEIVPGGGSVIFETSFGEKTVEIYAGEIYVTEETSGAPCLKYLDPVWACNLQKGEGVDWSVKNPNSFGLGYAYSLNLDAKQNDTIDGLGEKFLFYSVVDPQRLYVSWETEIWGPRNVHEDADVESCQENPTPTPTDPTPTDPTPTDPTPTDPPRQTTPIVPGTTPTVLVPVTASTPVPTLSAPEIVADPELIPVTGVDFSNAPFGIPALAILKGLLINLGLGLLGLGLVSQGLVGYLSKR